MQTYIRVCPTNGETLNRVLCGNLIDWIHTNGKPCYHNHVANFIPASQKEQ